MAHRKGAPTYDALSRWYSLISEPSEGPLRRECLRRLRLRPGEAVLEIGSGPGVDLPAMAAAVGSAGRVWGLDLSGGMLRQCRRRLPADPENRFIRLTQADGLRLPFRPDAFDAVLLSFTLELFGDDEIPGVLRETARVLRSHGRVGVVSLSNRKPDELATRIYWRAHRAAPGLIDCRPINASETLRASGYALVEDVERSMWGLRVAVLVAQKTA
jgi:ubiquinone/menaquinone biosynthesis C-methylase UbiE